VTIYWDHDDFWRQASIGLSASTPADPIGSGLSDLCFDFVSSLPQPTNTALYIGYI
jgi:hypothetical protein